MYKDYQYAESLSERDKIIYFFEEDKDDKKSLEKEVKSFDKK